MPDYIRRNRRRKAGLTVRAKRKLCGRIVVLVGLVWLVVLVGLVTRTDPASNVWERKKGRKKGAIAAIVTYKR